jgi:formate hydrogenlyase subunit 4
MRGNVLAIAVQLSGLVLAPLLPGVIQTIKARLQGRVGTSPLQPYRDLRRLWGKRSVAPYDSTYVYRLAPSLSAAALACAVLVVPIGASTIGWLGSDMLVPIGLLALARFSTAAAAWDPGGGFSLMAAGRDLMFSVFAEPLLLLAFVLVAIGSHSTDLVQMVAAAGDPHVATLPAHWCAALAFGLVVLVETGRQPIDNPDTHLELTMVHEGPLLEYAGRDLAMLQWTAAARHWLMLVLAVTFFVPMPAPVPWNLLTLALGVAGLCALVALVETSLAKMRILRVPVLLGAGVAICMIGLASWIAQGAL